MNHYRLLIGAALASGLGALVILGWRWALAELDFSFEGLRLDSDPAIA